MPDSRGGRAAILLYILIGVIAAYIVMKTIPPYMHYYSLDDEIGQQLHLSSINNDDIIIGDLMNKVNDLGLPISRDKISLSRKEDESVEIKMAWDEEVDYGYGVKKKFSFSIDDTNRGKTE